MKEIKFHFMIRTTVKNCSKPYYRETPQIIIRFFTTEKTFLLSMGKLTTGKVKMKKCVIYAANLFS